ncbi:hypothetical protein DBA29_27690 [Xenophilus aerolatus]|nr:hypothetical protein [Xenophilus aerolatus]
MADALHRASTGAGRVLGLVVHVAARQVRRQRSGLGIGLALAREIVGSHRGTAEVRSEGIGKGSELTIRIPLHPPR